MCTMSRSFWSFTMIRIQSVILGITREKEIKFLTNGHYDMVFVLYKNGIYPGRTSGYKKFETLLGVIYD